MLALLDIPAAYTEEYNRWYDLDHLPEHVSKGDVLAGRRYVATRALRSAPGIVESDWSGGYPPYLTNYLFGGPLDFTSDEARQGWLTKDRGIVRAGRYWREGQGRHNSYWRLAGASARPSVLVSEAAIPWLAHRGVIVAAGRAQGDAVAWWNDVHLVDLFAVPGMLAALRFEPVAEENADIVLHLLLCEDDPATVMEGIDRSMRYQRAVGRFPAHGGVYEPLAFLPYQRIIPLEYDFEL